MNEIDYINMSGVSAKYKGGMSQLEKNRLALKFIEMNQSPERYGFFQRFADDKVKKVKLNLPEEELAKYQKLIQVEN